MNRCSVPADKARSLFFLLCLTAVSCADPYRRLSQEPAPVPSVTESRAVVEREVYRCVADGGFLFKRYHLSGLLLLKTMPDSSLRILFQNEMGFPFFDFGWDRNDSFRVHHIMDRMDRPGLIRTLRKDFELLLMKRLDTASEQVFRNEDGRFHRIPFEGGMAWYGMRDGRPERITHRAGRRLLLDAHLSRSPGLPNVLPDTIRLDHPRAGFKIRLSRTGTMKSGD